jgi:hypothetical protein
LGNEKVKKESKPRSAPKKDTGNQTLAKTVARYEAQRKSVGDKLFAGYDLALVAQIAAQISREYRNPEEAAKEALQLLDACSQELSARSQKREIIAKAAVPPVGAFHCNFRDGIELVNRGRDRSRDAKRRYGSANADERRGVSAAVSKPAGKVAGIVYPKHSGADRAGNIVFCEGAARQEKRVSVAIAADVVTADCA